MTEKELREILSEAVRKRSDSWRYTADYIWNAKEGYENISITVSQVMLAMSEALKKQANEHANMVENRESDQWLADMIRGTDA